MEDSLEWYDYNLPKELIAQEHAFPRSYSRFLVVRPLKGKMKYNSQDVNLNIEHKRFYDIIHYLKRGDVLVLNRTRVMKNKIVGKKTTGARIEIILMRPLDKNKALCRIKSSSNVRVGNEYIFNGYRGKVVGRDDDIFTVEFDREMDKIMDNEELPNPPYIKNRVTDNNYQTVYGKEKGSLAAPTAGLHFTKNLLDKIVKKGVKIAFVTLHVGFGTFLPVRDINTHKMEPEWYSIDRENAELINNAERLFVVGTTTLKSLESSAKNGRVVPGSAWSDLFIKPGYEFELNMYALITNFHLPRSTLMLLVSAFYGRENILKIYKEAIGKRYKFFSLGDAMMLMRG